MKDTFKFKLGDKAWCPEFGTIDDNNMIYIAIKHPEDDKLFIVTYPWEENIEGWDATVYSLEDIKDNFDDGSWILID
jgi:hypothetical protein